MAANIASVSCVECQRRKQKCNRQFPCDHCLKRGVSHLCHSAPKAAAPKSAKNGHSNDDQSRTSKRRHLESPPVSEPDDDGGDDFSDIDVSGALNGLGYMSHHHHLVLGHDNGRKAVRDAAEKGDIVQSEELKAALLIVPEKPYIDCLVDNWLNGANYHYYALYPPEFRTQYDGWCATPRNKVTPELTSLILRVCACSLHFIIDDHVRARLESELETDAATLAKRIHTAAEKVSASIAPGKGGLVHVQQLFLTAFWFKSAEKWTEAWHALSKAIRAANEIGLHQDSLSEGMSEFDREMRRRLWVVLFVWDFSLGSMLSRPFLINHADCTVEMPTLVLERNPQRLDQPSPFRHMNLHSQLCLDMAEQLGNLSRSGADKAEVARQVQDMVDKWFANLPAEYALEAPDTRWDGEYSWVVFQRRYLHLIGYMSLFSQLKPFVMQSSAKPMTSLESTLREAGVQAALGLKDVSWRLFENMFSVGAKFHYAVFCIFDSATVMCSALLHDEARNLPQRNAVLEATQKGLSMLGELYSESKTAAVLYCILRGLLAEVPLSDTEQGAIGAPKRKKRARTGSPGNKVPLARSPGGRSARDVLAETNQAHGSHRASSDITLESSSFQPDSDGRTNAHSPSDDQARRGSTVLPPQGVAQMDGLPSSSGFIPSTTLVSSYPATTDGFIPATSAMPSSVFVASEGFAPAHGFVQSATFQYGSSALGSPGTLPYSQAGWQPQGAISDMNGMGMFQGGNLAGFHGATPTVLEYWDWQGLGVGHPVSWGHSSAQVNDQSLGGGRATANDDLGSSVAGSPPNSR